MQWNIGGGRIREPSADPVEVSPYSTESVRYLAQIAITHSPDIITLQETHESTGGYSQAQALAEAIGFNHCRNDVHNESHIEKGQMFGQAILSRFPITSHDFQRLPNPNLTVMSESGEVLHSHNYGISSVDIDTPEGEIHIQTFHLPALHFFEVTTEAPESKDVFATVGASIEKPTRPTVIAGDYNIDELFVLDVLTELRKKGFNETPTDRATTPSGKRLDHVVHFEVRNTTVKVLDTALTDHYPLLADFEI